MARLYVSLLILAVAVAFCTGCSNNPQQVDNILGTRATINGIRVGMDQEAAKALPQPNTGTGAALEWSPDEKAFILFGTNLLVDGNGIARQGDSQEEVFTRLRRHGLSPFWSEDTLVLEGTLLRLTIGFSKEGKVVGVNLVRGFPVANQ